MARGGRRLFAVIGLGNFGGMVAAELVRYGNHVIGIDRDERVAGSYAETLTQAIVCDARDEDALREAGLGDCAAALVSVGDSLEASVLATMHLKMIGVEKIWAKASSRTHHRILSKLGSDRVIHPEEEMGRQIAQVLNNPLVRDFVSLGNGLNVVNFTVPESLEGKIVADLDLLESHDLRCIGVMRGSEYLGHADCREPLTTDDRLLLLGRRAELRKFAAEL